jgi:hypothetical protein
MTWSNMVTIVLKKCKDKDWKFAAAAAVFIEMLSCNKSWTSNRSSD